jgi:uncharacterized protein YjiS (DUF1127 family)
MKKAMQFMHDYGSSKASVATQHGNLPLFRSDSLASAGEKGKKTMLVAIINFLRSWKRYNASLRELSQLGDRELADIGITRSDIPRIAWENSNR